MLLILTVVITATAVASLFRMRMPGDPTAAQLGQMSEQWLAEHRAAHTS